MNVLCICRINPQLTLRWFFDLIRRMGAFQNSFSSHCTFVLICFNLPESIFLYMGTACVRNVNTTRYRLYKTRQWSELIHVSFNRKYIIYSCTSPSNPTDHCSIYGAFENFSSDS